MVVKLPFPDQARFLAETVTRSYAQIFFSRSKSVGLLLLVATSFEPTLLAAGLLSVLVATLVALVMNLSSELIRSGVFGYNAILVGFGCAALLGVNQSALVLMVAAVSWSVVLTAALRSALSATFALPVLSLPFLLVFYSVLGASSAMGMSWGAHLDLTNHAALAALPLPIIDYLEALGAIFFSPSATTGLFVWLALMVHSRIGFLLSFLGFAASTAVGVHLLNISDPAAIQMLGFNGILVAIALGGVWFVPSISSTVAAAAAVVGSNLVAIALLPLSHRLGAPLLIVPFNVTVIVLLYAMRQRARDERPKAVDFATGTPEENLTYYQTRIARFGARYAVRFRAPFLGKWACSQGVDGELTHRGPWRYALDFQVEGSDGERFEHEGSELSHFHCYGLPVTATASGTVVKVVDNVPDNAIGETNLEQNWGNLVLICHGAWLYSLVCHLSPGTIKVHEGQVVTVGTMLGLCGSSGRSPEPHLHFQLQASPHIGAPTLPIELNDVVTAGFGADAAPHLHASTIPAEGEAVRNLEPQLEIAGLLDLPMGERLVFRDQRGVTETLEPEIDIYGRRVLQSKERGASLYYEHTAELFTIFDTVGSRRSHLHMIQLALGRLPFEIADDLEWTDFLPIRRLLPTIAGPFYDLFSLFVPGTGYEMRYHARRTSSGLQVLGRSRQCDAEGNARVTTSASFDSSRGLDHIAVKIGRRRHSISRDATNGKIDSRVATRSRRIPMGVTS